MSNKKILNFIPNFYFGGVENTNITLSRELQKLGYEVNLLTNNIIDNNFLNNGIENIKSFKKRKMSQVLFDLTKYIKKENPGLIICSQFYANIILIMACIISRYKNKLILCERIPINEGLKNIFFIKRILLKILIKILYQRADVIVCNSYGTQNDLEKIISKINSCVIYNPVLSENLNYLANKKVDDYIFDDNFTYLITVSRISNEKNIQEMISIVSQLSSDINFKLLIIGDGENLDNLKKYVNTTCISNKINFLGYKNNPYKYLKKSDIYLSTAEFEGLGNSLIEALYFRLSVVAYDSPGGISEVLGDGKYGYLITKGDQIEFLNVLENLILDNDKCTSNGIDNHLDFFLKHNVVKNYIKLIKNIES